MKIIRISHPIGGGPKILRQLTNQCTIIGDYELHINDAIPEADYWFVLDGLSSEVESCFCPREHVFLTTGEPPFVKLYSRANTEQYSRVFSCQKNIIKRHNGVQSIPFLPWMAGARQLDGMNVWDDINYLDYDYFSSDMDFSGKLDKIAVITSNKRITKGHCQRLDFIEYLQSVMPDKIDLYGNGFNPIKDKYPIISKYKYMLVLENCSYPSYVTEKIMDAYLCKCFPFYYGAPDIYDYFKDDELLSIDILNKELSYHLIDKALKDDIFSKSIEQIIKGRQRVLDDYNMFSLMLKIVKKQNSTEPATPEKEVVELINQKKDLAWRVKTRLKKYFAIDF